MKLKGYGFPQTPVNHNAFWLFVELVKMNMTHKTPRAVRVEIVNGFVTDGGGGNPAGVVLDADGLSEAEMLRIAGLVGHSETAFVSRSVVAGFKFDFFTPNRRIAHCGHATIAAFSHLAALGRVAEGETSKETVDGPRKVVVRQGAAYMEQTAPIYRSPDDWAGAGVSEADVLASLGLTAGDLDPQGQPVLANTGNSFVLVGVRDSETLRALKPDSAAIADISEKLDLIGYYVFTRDPAATGKDATTRMFAPRYAIEEESGTGMAAGPLACLLHDRYGVDNDRLVIEQGHYMEPASPSTITVDLRRRDGRIVGLMAGGHGKAMRSFEIAV